MDPVVRRVREGSFRSVEQVRHHRGIGDELRCHRCVHRPADYVPAQGLSLWMRPARDSTVDRDAHRLKTAKDVGGGWGAAEVRAAQMSTYTD